MELKYGSGDSLLIENVMPECIDTLFYELRDEVKWHEVYHKSGLVPRLLSIQGEISVDNAVPVYRHPMDEIPALSPFSPIVGKIKQRLETVLNQRLNHVLIQWYRNGNDYISEHSDKTLDIEFGSNIVGMSLGATRNFVLKSKRRENRVIENIKLPNNSVFVIGWDTNRSFLHAIKPDKRMLSIKNADEIAFNGERISLTFRSISTFQLPNGQLYGQGAKLKFYSSNISIQPENLSEQLNCQKFITESQELPKPLIAEKEKIEEALKLLKAFSAENREELFDWNAHYGCGYDITDMKFGIFVKDNDLRESLL